MTKVELKKIIEYIEQISNTIANKTLSPIEKISRYIEENIKKIKVV